MEEKPTSSGRALVGILLGMALMFAVIVSLAVWAMP